MSKSKRTRNAFEKARESLPIEETSTDQNKVIGHRVDLAKWKTCSTQSKINTKHPNKSFKATHKECLAKLPYTNGSIPSKQRERNLHDVTFPLNTLHLNCFSDKSIKVFDFPGILEHPVKDVRMVQSLTGSRLVLSKSSGFQPIASRNKPTLGELCLKFGNRSVDHKQSIIDPANVGGCLRDWENRGFSKHGVNDLFLKPENPGISDDDQSPLVKNHDWGCKYVTSGTFMVTPLTNWCMSRKEMRTLNVVPQVTSCPLHQARPEHRSSAPQTSFVTSSEQVHSRLFNKKQLPCLIKTFPIPDACAEYPLCKEVARRHFGKVPFHSSTKEPKANSYAHHVRLPTAILDTDLEK